MNWQDVDLKILNCVAAPHGGPIALIRNEKLIIAVTGIVRESEGGEEDIRSRTGGEKEWGVGLFLYN
jgi:hypothetical protein